MSQVETRSISSTPIDVMQVNHRVTPQHYIGGERHCES